MTDSAFSRPLASAVFFSYAASFFSPVKMIGTVGDDWPSEHTRFLEARGIDTSGIETIPGGKTFRWRGRYLPNMNDRETLEVHLNVFGEFKPKLNGGHRDSRFVFLGNASPVTQLSVLDQVPGASLTVADTMDLWINIQRDELEELLERVDGLVLNDAEAKLLAEDENLVRAGHAVRAMGPKFVVIKKGEHGAMFFSEHEMYVMPAYPTPQVLDPTGAGDSFAGGMMGHLAALGDGADYQRRPCHRVARGKDAFHVGHKVRADHEVSAVIHLEAQFLDDRAVLDVNEPQGKEHKVALQFKLRPRNLLERAASGRVGRVPLNFDAAQGPHAHAQP